jgi:hypothetical protein
MIRHGSSRLDCVSPIILFCWFSEPFLGDFLVVILRPFSLGFDRGCIQEPFVVIFLVIPLSNPWAKMLDFRFFLGFGKVVFLVEILRFLLIQWVLVDQIIAMACPWGTPNIPQVLCEIRRASRRIRIWIWRSWPEGRCSSRAPRPDRSDRCPPLVWPVQSPVGCLLCAGVFLSL